MKTKELLQTLKDYYMATRQCGHTTAMIRGVQNVDNAAILATTCDHAKTLKRIAPNVDVIPMYSHHALRGMRKPLVLDNMTMEQILAEALHEINRLEKQVSDLANVRDQGSAPTTNSAEERDQPNE
jgi:hypothetical protein